MIPADTRKGTVIYTPLGPGVLNYLRLSPEADGTAAAVSVLLDAKLDRPGYSGTIFPADSVSLTAPVPKTPPAPEWAGYPLTWGDEG